MTEAGALTGRMNTMRQLLQSSSSLGMTTRDHLRGRISHSVGSTAAVRPFRFGWLLCWMVVGGFGLVLPARASDEAAKKLLTDFWSHTLMRETDEYYRSIEHKSADVLYAYALVKSRQHDVDRALEAIDQLHAIDDSVPQPWRLKTWLLLRKDAFDQAVVTLGKYVETVKKDKSLDDFNRAEAYRFAGRVFAFLEGPVARKTNDVTVAAIKRQVLFKLEPDLLNALTFDYQDVEDQYKKMMTAKERHEEQFAKQDAVERKMKFEQLEKREEQLSGSKERLDEESGNIRQDASRELEAIRQADLPLASQQASLEAELSMIGSDLIFLFNDFNYWNNLALREVNPRLRAFYFQQAGFVDGLIIQQEWSASQVRAQLRQVQSERIALRQQYAATNTIASNQLAMLQKEIQEISRQQKVTSNQKLRTTKPTKKIITPAVSLKTKATSIVTFDQFPLEIERQLLLDRVK